MSSRALRKVQREREEQEQLRRLKEEAEALEQSDEEEDEEPIVTRPQKSAFALLDESGGEEEVDEVEPEEAVAHMNEASAASSTDEVASTTKSAPKRKKKKKKTKQSTKPVAEPLAADDGVDDIDLALKSLATSKGIDAGEVAATDPTTSELCRLLSVDTQHLRAANEMRRLFGRAALEGDHDDDQNAGGRRRDRGRQQGLAAALGRRQGAPGGRGSGLAQLGLRRNIFIQGKEEWPVGTAGGLGMEIVEKGSDGTVEYRFLHNRAYQDVQGQFEDCVAGMDPQRMIQLLQYNPYHISTLLQVSEIAKQDRDHTTSGDLLERALFSFGRAVHSTFATNLSQGKARLNFCRPENREFWLAANRYIANLGMRATWRTVYEWSKLLLALDPEHDPYRMSLVTDQYAIRSRQYQHFLDLSSCAFFTSRWKQLPNIQLSRGIAFVGAEQQAKGKQTLYTAVSRYPWVVARLFQELNIDPPPAIWGKSPRTDWEKLHTELYATRAKDLWNTPEASNLLVEISSAVSSETSESAIVDKAIGSDEGRHILLTDTPALIALLPRSITVKVTSTSDPLPPDDDMPSYTPRSASQRPAQRTTGPAGHSVENQRELLSLYSFFAGLFPWFNPRNGDEGERPPEMTEEEVERRIAESGVSEELIVQRTQRMMELQAELLQDTQEDDIAPE